MNTDDQIMHFRPRIQADLEWIIRSPDLISVTHASQQLPEDLVNASDLITEFEAIKAAELKISAKPLGRYFEHLWFQCIAVQPHIQILHKNLQLFDDKQTVGEFDAIIRQLNTDVTVHCELAVKFYLNLGTGEQLSHWFGPNLNDRLEKKYHHLLSHQLRLSSKLNSRNNILNDKLSIDLIGLFTRGRLYYPIDDFLSNTFNHPREINSKHLKGFWVLASEFESFHTRIEPLQWYVLPKSHWLAELQREDIATLNQYDANSLKDYQQVAAVKDDREIMRGFIVSESWLAVAKNI